VIRAILQQRSVVEFDGLEASEASIVHRLMFISVGFFVFDPELKYEVRHSQACFLSLVFFGVDKCHSPHLFPSSNHSCRPVDFSCYFQLFFTNFPMKTSTAKCEEKTGSQQVDPSWQWLISLKIAARP